MNDKTFTDLLDAYLIAKDDLANNLCDNYSPSYRYDLNQRNETRQALNDYINSLNQTIKTQKENNEG